MMDFPGLLVDDVFLRKSAGNPAVFTSNYTAVLQISREPTKVFMIRY